MGSCGGGSFRMWWIHECHSGGICEALKSCCEKSTHRCRPEISEVRRRRDRQRVRSGGSRGGLICHSLRDVVWDEVWDEMFIRYVSAGPKTGCVGDEPSSFFSPHRPVTSGGEETSGASHRSAR